jgi:hypothetical protein
MSSRIEEYRATYKRMPDAQLLELAEQVDDLTDEAQTALRAELDRRGIAEAAGKTPDKEPAPSSPAMPAEVANWGILGEHVPTLPPSELVAVFSAATEAEAAQVQEALHAAGIECQLQIVILVPQAEAEQAFEVLSEQLGPEEESEDGEDEEGDEGEEDD